MPGILVAWYFDQSVSEPQARISRLKLIYRELSTTTATRP